jgi:hypothetical protein
MPSETLYHRWLGWHAVGFRRAITVALVGLAISETCDLESDAIPSCSTSVSRRRVDTPSK